MAFVDVMKFKILKFGNLTISMKLKTFSAFNDKDFKEKKKDETISVCS